MTMHKWEKIAEHSYATDYKCILCGEFHRIFRYDENNSIGLPPNAHCFDEVIKND